MPHNLAHDIQEAVGGGGGNGGGGGGNSGGGGGGGGGSSSSGGGSSGTDTARFMRHYKLLLRGMGLSPKKYAKALRVAAKRGYSDSDLLVLVSRSSKFRKQFPGIKTLLKTEGSVEGAIRVWRTYNTELRNTLAQLGLSSVVSLNKGLIGVLIKRGVSADEFVSRVSVVGKLAETEGTRTAFNAYLTSIGRKALSEQDWGNFLSKSASRDLYDLYEGFSIAQAGGGRITALDADAIAKALGVSGQAADLSSLTDAISRFKMEAGQELAAAGVAETDLFLVPLREQLSGDQRLKAEAATRAVEQILSNRKARTAQRQQAQPALSQSGRPVLASAPQAPLQSIG